MRNCETSVVLIEGVREIWRIDDEWWRNTIARTYYEVLLGGGTRMVLFVDQATERWFAQMP